MPLYEFVCQDCQTEFETLIFGRETPECPGCQSVKLERKISVVAAPRSEGGPLPMKQCMSEGPPCGPVCSRFRNN